MAGCEELEGKGKVNLRGEVGRWLGAVEHHIKKGEPATLTVRQVEGWRAVEAMMRAQAGPPCGG